MKKMTWLAVAMLVFGGVGMAQLQAPADDTTPAVGARAPNFGLEELRGETKVLLAFFPAAFTPG